MIVIFDASDLPHRKLAQTFGFKRARIGRKTRSDRWMEVTIATGPTWTAIGDWNYSLWHSQDARPAIWDLASRYRLLAFSMGDTDDSYSFHHFQNGALVRELLIRDTLGGGAQEVVVDSGPALRGEGEDLCRGSDLYECVRSIALAEGFDPSTARSSSQWRVVDPRSSSERAGAEQALMETPWAAYSSS